jgi:hypothetical protein
MSEWGVFPFGKPNSERPARRAKKADAVVIGVSPSAWHVHWTAPANRQIGPRGSVDELAVDVAPTLFWDGALDDFDGRLTQWKHDVGFRDGEHGTISPVLPSQHGGTSTKVLAHYLAPLGLDVDRVSFTDIYPVFTLKSAGGMQREAGDAIREEYDPLAPVLGFAPCTLPAQADLGELPRIAAERFGARLVDDLAAAKPSLVITLGRDVWATLMRLPALRPQSPVVGFDALKSDQYGAVGSLFINASRVNWLPLVHPGLLGRASEWETLHAAWAVSPKTLL